MTTTTHRGIQIVPTDPGPWLWACDVTGAAGIAETQDEARNQIDRHLGPEAKE